MPRKKDPRNEAIEAARRGMTDSKASAAVRIMYFDRFCALTKVLNVPLKRDLTEGGKPAENMKTPNEVAEVKEFVATAVEGATSPATPSPTPAPAAPTVPDEFDIEMARMLKPLPREVKPEPKFNDLQLMRGEHLKPTSADKDFFK